MFVQNPSGKEEEKRPRRRLDYWPRWAALARNATRCPGEQTRTRLLGDADTESASARALDARIAGPTQPATSPGHNGRLVLVSPTEKAEALARRPARRNGYRLEALDGELLLYHPDETKVLYCNNTAALVWHLCDGSRTVRELIDLLVKVFPESADQLTNDVSAAIQELLTYRAVTC